MKSFQIILLAVFAFFAIAGVIVFSTFRGPNSSEESIPVQVWGTVPIEIMTLAMDSYNTEVDASEQILLVYREIREEEFDMEFVEALAEGRGPDAVLIPHHAIVKNKAKLRELSFESFPERTFKDSFIELGELYLSDTGVIGLPLLVDPIVLYWNRDIFARNGISLPPKTWEELVSMVDNITKRDEQNNILQSTIALGEFQNITHAKEILTMLFLQAGDTIIERLSGDTFTVTLGDRYGSSEIPADSVLRFYTEFANPVKALYSWNRSLPPSKDTFISGDTAMYIGFASEEREISELNPNLNFDVTEIPQIAGSDIKKTYGSMQGLAMVRATNNTNATFRAIALMTQMEFLSFFMEESGLPPVRRDMLSAEAPNASLQIFYDSALIADAFLDPDRDASEEVFKSMVEDVTSGRDSVNGSVISARNALSSLIP